MKLTKEKLMSEENTTPEVAITIQDLVLAANIIDLASQRGAFKAAEASQVGACFEKIVAFVNANQPPAPQPAEDAAATAEE